mgnify:CR=1 FL=1
MEVVMLEYTIIGFTPIIIASVTATLLHNVLYGAEMAFMAPGISITSLSEIPLILVYGVILGALAALFTKTITAMHRFQNQPILLRMLSAGLCTGVIAYFIPQVMGMGTDSIWIISRTGLGKTICHCDKRRFRYAHRRNRANAAHRRLCRRCTWAHQHLGVGRKQFQCWLLCPVRHGGYDERGVTSALSSDDCPFGAHS